MGRKVTKKRVAPLMEADDLPSKKAKQRSASVRAELDSIKASKISASKVGSKSVHSSKKTNSKSSQQSGVLSHVNIASRKLRDGSANVLSKKPEDKTRRVLTEKRKKIMASMDRTQKSSDTDKRATSIHACFIEKKAVDNILSKDENLAKGQDEISIRNDIRFFAKGARRYTDPIRLLGSKDSRVENEDVEIENVVVDSDDVLADSDLRECSPVVFPTAVQSVKPVANIKNRDLSTNLGNGVVTRGDGSNSDRAVSAADDLVETANANFNFIQYPAQEACEEICIVSSMEEMQRDYFERTQLASQIQSEKQSSSKDNEDQKRAGQNEDRKESRLARESNTLPQSPVMPNVIEMGQPDSPTPAPSVSSSSDTSCMTPSVGLLSELEVNIPQEVINVLENGGELQSAHEKLLLSALPEEYSKFMQIVTHSNGGASLLRANWAEIENALETQYHGDFAREFFKLGFAEVNKTPIFTIVILENGSQFENYFEYLAKMFPHTPVKMGSLCSKQSSSMTTMSEYHQHAMATCHHGTFKYGPLDHLSLVGKKQEECGNFFKKLVDLFDLSPLINFLMPWGRWSAAGYKVPSKSDDGPIFWVRPGEQMLKTDDLHEEKETKKSKRGAASTRAPVPSYRTRNPREIFFEDRTPCHADQVGDGLKRRPTAAVGLLQSVHGANEWRSEKKRALKDVVCFHAGDFERIVTELQIDLYEPPMTQCAQWVDDAKLNQLRRSGVKYSRFLLRADDVYAIPRRVVHQFRTINACCTVAWHLRLLTYYEDHIVASDDPDSCCQTASAP